MISQETNEQDIVMEYRERLADYWNNYAQLKRIRWDIENDEDLDESQSEDLYETVQKRIGVLVSHILHGE